MDTQSALPVGPDPSRSVDALSGGARQSSSPANESGSAAFRVLLDRLDGQARSLAEHSESLAAPDQLAEAVDVARSSLEDALSLGDQLVEAFRASVQRGDAPEGTR